MGLFNNIKNIASDVGKSLNESVNEVSVINKEIENKKTLEKEVALLNKDLDSGYRNIGEKFVESILKEKEFNQDEMIEALKTKIERKNVLKEEIIKIERKITDLKLMQEKEKVAKDMEREMEKLDKAVSLGVLSEADYEEKVRVYRNRIEYFKEIKNIQAQCEMEIISPSERDLKINEILNR